MPPLISVVVPVRGDTAAAEQLLPQLPASPALEVIVVDGGHDARLAELCERAGAQLLRTPPGRGRQMNAGAAVASGTWLLFLHADSQLPPAWQQHVGGVDQDTVGGWFRFALDDRAWQARVIERLVAWRVSALRLPYGDQGIFVRRTIFEALGGYRDLPLLEDVEFVKRLTRAGATRALDLPLVTSARRWRRDGWFRRSGRNVAIVALYFAGVSPGTLARWYR